MVSTSAMQQVSDALANKIKENQLEVPMLPEVAGKVLRLTQDPDSDASDLAKLIQSDQTLAGHVMRVANSALYSPNSSMVSLQQAITRLGMKVIAEIALATSVNSELFNAPGFEAHVAYEIKYSLAAGLWAKEVARACRKNVEAAFLAGLLHDIGRPVAVQSAVKLAKSMGASLTRDEVLEIERAHQQAIGVNVVQQWEMPQSVCQAVEYFHNYQEKHNAQMQTMIVVGGARIASHFMCEAEDKSECMTVDELYQQPVLADLNLYQDQIEQLLEKQEQVSSAVEAMTA